MGFCPPCQIKQWDFVQWDIVQWAFVLVGFCPSGFLSIPNYQCMSIGVALDAQFYTDCFEIKHVILSCFEDMA